MSEIKTEAQLEHHYGFLYLKLMQYLKLYSSEEEISHIAKENDYVHFHLKEGTYTIRFEDLAKKALKDIKRFKEESPGIELTDEIENLIQNL